jgi:XTP/dITP diphosphohydrolase
VSSGRHLYFASGNAHKVAEVQQLLGSLYHIKSLKDLGVVIDIPETGDSLEANSEIKARFLHTSFQVDAFADDSGLEVESLGGEPGVLSARYAGIPSDSKKNMTLLLQQMIGVENRRARFRTVVTLIQKEEIHQFEGMIQGQIAKSPIGTNGFGYDPIFIPEGETRTFAEMLPDEKNSMSHRGRAINKFADFLLS